MVKDELTLEEFIRAALGECKKILEERRKQMEMSTAIMDHDIHEETANVKNNTSCTRTAEEAESILRNYCSTCTASECTHCKKNACANTECTDATVNISTNNDSADAAANISEEVLHTSVKDDGLYGYIMEAFASSVGEELTATDAWKEMCTELDLLICRFLLRNKHREKISEAVLDGISAYTFRLGDMDADELFKHIAELLNAKTRIGK